MTWAALFLILVSSWASLSAAEPVLRSPSFFARADSAHHSRLIADRFGVNLQAVEELPSEGVKTYPDGTRDFTASTERKYLVDKKLLCTTKLYQTENQRLVTKIHCHSLTRNKEVFVGVIEKDQILTLSDQINPEIIYFAEPM